tara:strand:- start:1252 stop:1611 length:360 start_codon:yes stop_codon:yes gene_type:complete
MDVLKFFGIELIGDVYENRRRQLKNQVTQEKLFDKMKPHCPNDIIEFFILQRKLNRTLVNKYEDASIFSYKKITEDTMKIIDNDICNFNQVINSDFSPLHNCYNIREYNQYLENVIKEN